MKTTTILVICALVLCAACSKELEYSCNPEVNEWVVKNKEVYANVSRTKLATLDTDKQLGLFRSFAPEQKACIYQEKYLYLMGLDNLSILEKEQLTKLYQLVSPEIYEMETSREVFNEAADRWVEESQKLLGWGEKEVFLYTHTWLTLEEVNDRIEAVQAKPVVEDSFSKDPDCECYYSIYCVFSLKGITCKDGNCNKIYGCGVASASNCTGMCD